MITTASIRSPSGVDNEFLTKGDNEEMGDGENERIPRLVGKLAKTLDKTLNGVCCHMFKKPLKLMSTTMIVVSVERGMDGDFEVLYCRVRDSEVKRDGDVACTKKASLPLNCSLGMRGRAGQKYLHLECRAILVYVV